MDLHERIQSHLGDPDEHVEQRTVGSIFTTLGLILLTLMVYLMSLAEPDRERHANVYTSLAKAFLFAEQREPEPVAKHSDQLLSDARLALRDMAAYLDRAEQADRILWDGANLIVTLPEGTAQSVPEALLTYLARMGGAMNVAVNVEAHSSPEDAASGATHVALAQAVLVAERLVALQSPLDPAQVQAVGFPTPLRLADGLEAETLRLRVVFVHAEETL